MTCPPRDLAPTVVLAALSLVVACGDPLPPPVIEGVSPASTPAGYPVTVTVLGHFELDVMASFTSPGRSRLATDFRATLGDVTLTAVTYLDSGRLSARIPGTLPPGAYDLTVEDPAGRRAHMAGAFTVTPCDPPDCTPPVEQLARVGSVAAATSAIPGTQVVVHGLGVVPAALLLWTTGGTGGTGYRFAIGVSDGPDSSASVSLASAHGPGGYDGCRLLTRQALTVANFDRSVRREARLAGWDASTFTLEWTTPYAGAMDIHWVVLGGPELQARLVPWQMPENPGPFAVEGVGFAPDAVLHLLSGALLEAPPPTGDDIASIAMGAMTAEGEQWAYHVYALGGGGGFTSTWRGRRTDAAIYTDRSGPSKLAHFVSMDPDGFTLDFTEASAERSRVFSLALAGRSANARAFVRDATGQGGVQTVDGLGARPPGVVLTFTTQGSASSSAGLRLGVGATDGSASVASAISNASGPGAARVHAVDRLGAVVLEMDNDEGAVDAEASLVDVAPGAFSVQWSEDPGSSNEILTLTLGAR